MFGNKRYRLEAPIGIALGASAASATAVGFAASAMVAGTVMSAVSAQKQAKATKEASAAQQRAASVQNAAERMKAVREARIRAAQVQAASGNMGVGAASSGVVGATSSIGSQLGANIGRQNVLLGFAEQASQANQRAASAAAQGATWQAIGSLAGSVFNAKGGWASVMGANTIPDATKKSK